MRSCVLGIVLAASAAGCARSSGQAEVPTAPVPRETKGGALTSAGPRAKLVPAPGPQAAPNERAKQLP
ncbi:hypothetical protein FTUN_4477 [Frigoriglobus tundricola]|uniref:Uncharacterized protein n=1 Tax=Frigoriglobus tundricola TaxID=2774151 RepID=A0A6M5YS62_9BACT|nr:hypothetical protein FTUN_4477 [Frigoriglobus tundricola]